MLLALPAAPLPAIVRQGLEHLFSLGLVAGLAWSILLLVDVAADVLAVHYCVDVAGNVDWRGPQRGCRSRL